MEKLAQLRQDRRHASAKARRELRLGNLVDALKAQGEANRLTAEIAIEEVAAYDRNTVASLATLAKPTAVLTAGDDDEKWKI